MERELYVYDFLEKNGLRVAQKACVFAKISHEGQKRDDGEDYFNHPLAVCHTLIVQGIADDIMLAAALLHDTCEDCGLTARALREFFPHQTTNLVNLLTKKKNESPEIVFTRIASDTRTVLIKLADRTHNMSKAIGVFSPGRLQKYIVETEDHVLPMAARAAAESPYYRRQIIALTERIDDQVRAAKLFLSMSLDNEKLRRENMALVRLSVMAPMW